ncbi:MAG: purine-nucleoside phosphorylase [Firmicutes bacterium]|nr:purine-nucleoside phosphorylase [Bacillota bacterium]
MFENTEKAYEYVRTITDFQPEIAVTLGSGLGDVADSIEEIAAINYRDIPGFPVSTVAGHRGRYFFCKVGDKKVAFMQGRVHYYEGYPMEDVVMPLRVLHKMGCKILMLTNAAGGVNFQFDAGDIMLIRDHISSLVPSPLIGENYPAGTRFPDMSNVYDTKLTGIIRETAAKMGISVKEGVYIQLSGPNYETPAEVRMCRLLGADAVGMSTACEAMAAVQCGMKVCGISCITNLAAGMSIKPLSHDEVKETADLKGPQLRRLIIESIKNF